MVEADKLRGADRAHLRLDGFCVKGIALLSSSDDIRDDVKSQVQELAGRVIVPEIITPEATIPEASELPGWSSRNINFAG